MAGLLPEPVGPFAWLLLGALAALAIGASLLFGAVGALISVGLVGLLLILRRSEWAIAVLILLHIFIVHGTEAITLWEVAFMLLFMAFVASWFFRALVLERRRLLNSTADRLLAGFLAAAVLSIVPAVIQGNSLLLWAREVFSLAIFLLYFPAKAAIKEKKALPLFVACMVILALVLAVQAVINYKTLAFRAIYLWQLQSSRQTEDEQMFMTMVIATGAFVLYGGGWKRTLVSAGLLLTFALALAVTFSRGYWVAAAVGLLIVFVIVGRRQKIRAAVMLSTVGVVAVFLLTVVFGKEAQSITGQMGSRLMTLTSAREDVSVQSRISEYTAVTESALRQPVIGRGFGAKYLFYDPIWHRHIERNFTHNSYLYIFFKMGLVGLGFFLAFLLRMLWMAWKVFRKSGRSDRPLTAAIVAVLVALAIVSITSPQILQKNSILIFLLCFSVTSALYEQLFPAPALPSNGG